jgi:putative transferase (TIGR04331 family)
VPPPPMATTRRKLLVTTALERTWGDAEDILFLGDWCKIYERRHIWEARRHETVEFHWDDRAKLKRDYDYLEGLHGALLSCLAAALNRFHRTDYSTRYWRILADPWLTAYLGTMFDRWECLRIALEEPAEIEVVATGAYDENFPPFSYADFIARALSDEWNFVIFQRIIDDEYRGRVAVRREQPAPSGTGMRRPRPTAAGRRSMLRRLVSGVDRCLGRCVTRYDVMFLASYFNLSSLLRLNFAIGQVPRLFLTEFEPGGVPPEEATAGAVVPDRSRFRFDFDARSAFEEFIRKSVSVDLPSCLLESYAVLRDRANKMTIETKAIVTANSHWFDFRAKAWMAEQVARGAKLVILEHGGSLPYYKYFFDFEEGISDIRGIWFFPYHPKQIQLPPSKLVNRYAGALWRFRLACGSKYCSVIGNENARYVHRVHFNPFGAQGLVSVKSIIDLFHGLDEMVRRSFRIKPYPAEGWGWNTRQRFSDALGAGHLLAETRIDRVFSQSRVIVCTYPDTTFAEAMATGLPTVLLYAERFYELHPAALPLLELLRSARIVFHDPAAAALHINSIWDDPGAWWDSPASLAARVEFRRQAANADNGWLTRWKSFVKTIAA